MATIKAITVNREVQLQALVDGKKIIVTKASIRSDLQLNDEEGMDCLQNATIFEELTRMSAKTTAWNEFSSTMASAIICLSTNQKFNFSKVLLKRMVKNLDNVGKFLMYPRETPLFPTMVVQNQAEMGESLAILSDPYHTPIIIESTSQPLKKQRSRRPKKKDTQIPKSSVPSDNVADDAVNEEMDDSLVRASTTNSGLEVEQDSGCGPKHQETMRDTISQTRSENVSKLSNDPLLARDCLSLGDYKFKTESQEVREERRIKNSQAQKIIQEITLVDETQGGYGDDIMYDVSDLAGEEVFVAEQGVLDSKKDDVVNTAGTAITAQALAELKSAKPTTAASTRPRAKGLVIHEQEQAPTPTVSS
ncbi:hypothetical protein Tco_0313898 [Tanacetum coccineum]